MPSVGLTNVRPAWSCSYMALLTLRYRPAPLCSYEACSSLSFVSVFLPFTFSDDSSDIQPSFLTDPAPHKLPLSCIGLETKTPHFYLPPPYISRFYSERLCDCGYASFPVFRSSNISTYFSLLHINQNYGKLNFL